MSFDTSEARVLFERTVELIAKNKINKLNAFEKRVVDTEGNLLQPFEIISRENEWIESASMIEAHGKIYGYCIDFLYEEAVKILGGVNRTIDDGQKFENSVRRQRIGNLTLETNENAISSQDFEKKALSDPFYENMKSKFDCSKFDTLLSNTLFLNPNLDLVFDNTDKILMNESLIISHEVNLEGILTFSCNEIQSLSLCQVLENKKDLPETSDYLITGLQQIPELYFPLDNDEVSISENLNPVNTSDMENEYFEVGEIPSDEIPLLLSSSRVFKLRDFLLTNYSKPRKRQRITEESVSDYEVPTNVQSIQIQRIQQLVDNNQIQLISFYQKNENSMANERGYKEQKLAQLFTRSGSFQEIRRRRVRDEEPLAVDPLFNINMPESFNLVSSGRLELNLKVLKELIERITEDEQKRTFRKVIDELAGILPFDQAKSLSVHACFIIMLHIANEKSVLYEQTNDCDFRAHD